MATQISKKRKPMETLRIPNCPWTEIQRLTELNGGSGSFDPSLYRARPPSFLSTPNKRRSPTPLFTLFPSNSGSRPEPTTEAASDELRRVTDSTTVRRSSSTVGTNSSTRADIWSFGITALELAHGYAPFSNYQPMKKYRENKVSLGQAVLKGYGFFTEERWFWIGVCAVFGYTVIFNIMFTLCLTFLNPLGGP